MRKEAVASFFGRSIRGYGVGVGCSTTIFSKDIDRKAEWSRVYKLILERFAVQGFRPLTLSASAQWREAQN